MTDDSPSRGTCSTPSFPTTSDYDGLGQNILETNVIVFTMCCRYWISFCKFLHQISQKCFEWLGFKIGCRPYHAIALCLVAAAVSVVGFMNFQEINQIEKLYIPQKSEAMQLIARGNRHFPLKVREEEIVLFYKNETSALRKELFQENQRLHELIMNISGIKDICIKDIFNNCTSLTPLETVDHNPKNIHNISETVNRIYRNRTIVFSNGRNAEWNFPEMFGYFKVEEDVLFVKSLRSQYFMQYPDTTSIYVKEKEWEKQFLVLMTNEAERLEKSNITLMFNAGRSADDSILASSLEDEKLVSVSVVLMVLFCALALSKFSDPVRGHFLLGLGGIMTIIIGITTAFGFVMFIGFEFISFAGVIPFLVLGVGIDNIFIITNCIDRQDDTMAIAEKIAKAMGSVGASITMITITDLVAFLVSTVTDFPAIMYFCTYIAFSIVFSYILVCTLFAALLAIDMKRIKNKRIDFFPCVPAISSNDDIVKSNQKSFFSKVMECYSKILMLKPTRFFVIITSLIMLTAGVLGALKTDQSFDTLALGKPNSPYVNFMVYKNRAFSKSFGVSIINDNPNLDYTDPRTQKAFLHLDDIVNKNNYVKNRTMNWMRDFSLWQRSKNLTTYRKNFYFYLSQFLKQHPDYYDDIVFDKQQQKIISSRIIVFSSEDNHPLQRKEELLSLREELKKKSRISVYAVSLAHIYIEQFVVILRDTIRNTAISSATIFLITLPYLINPLITFAVFSGFVSLIFELLGLMYVWGVALNSLSMIIIVMAIGFAVDYSAHIAHGFVVSSKLSSIERMTEVMNTIGASVLCGGLSTIIGILVTAFATSEIFRIFFKMMFSIVLLGLIHGLVILPVYLATFTPDRNEIPYEQYDSDKRKGKPVEGIGNIAVLSTSTISNQTDITLNQKSIENTLDNL